jgi:thiol:disulfide interchange protein DsbA
MSLFKTFIASMALVLAGCASTPVVRDHDVDKDGYTLLSSKRSLEGAERADVVVFFHYACPHCHRLYADQLRDWIQKNPARTVSFVPVTWSSTLTPLARAYHAGAQAGLHPAYHEALFVAVQKDPALPRDAAFFADVAADCCSADRQAFKALYGSDAVEQRMVAAADVLRRVQIDRTPTVVVDGKYLITTSSAGSAEDLIRLMDELLSP